MDKKREPNGLVQTSINIDPGLHAQLREVAAWSKLSMSDVASHALSSLFSVVAVMRQSVMQQTLPLSLTAEQDDEDQRSERDVMEVVEFATRKFDELISEHQSMSEEDVEVRLNRIVFMIALFHDQWSDRFVDMAMRTASECGLRRARAERTIARASEAAKKRNKRTPDDLRNEGNKR
jgi:hypothetical protein